MKKFRGPSFIFTMMFLGDRNIKEMKIKCDNSDNGCEWIGELCAVDEHLSTCDYNNYISVLS